MLFNIPLNLNLLFYNKNFSRKNIAHCKYIERFNLYTSNRTEQFSLSLKACLETGPCVTKPREIFLNELHIRDPFIFFITHCLSCLLFLKNCFLQYELWKKYVCNTTNSVGHCWTKKKPISR